MKLISHRGNYDGINSEKENKPSYIDTTLSMGFDVEVDIRYIDGDFFLGHDTPDTKINERWIELRKDKIWFHCKDLESVKKFSEWNLGIKYFCHSNDPFILTSTNHIWVHDLSLNLDKSCIIPLLDKKSLDFPNKNNVFAICTDYIKDLKKLYE
jgi:hypothetical protein